MINFTILFPQHVAKSIVSPDPELFHLTHDRRGRGLVELCDTSVNYSGVSMLAGFLSAATRWLSHSKTMDVSKKDTIQSSKVFMAVLLKNVMLVSRLVPLQVMIPYI